MSQPTPAPRDAPLTRDQILVIAGMMATLALAALDATVVGTALTAGEHLKAEGIASIYTRLGEHLVEIGEAAAVADHYMGVLDAIHQRRLPGEISVKPSQLGLDFDAQRTFEHAARLAARAGELDGFLWIDMESSQWTEPTLVLYERLRASHPNVGLCL